MQEMERELEDKLDELAREIKQKQEIAELELEMWPIQVQLQMNKREQEVDRMLEIKRELQVIRSPSLILEQLRFRLDDRTKRSRRKNKFHEHERGYEILKKTLHQLDRQFEELQESKQELMYEEMKFNPWLLTSVYSLQDIEQKWHNLKCKFVQKLRELNYWQKEILLRAAYLDSLLVCLLVLYAVHVEDTAHQGGGFRNLLLDGWWLEFWEIVLLAAGDVERNPGPRQITDEELAEVSDIPIEEDDLSLVFDALLPVSAKWSRVCCSLRLQASLIDTIKKNHPGDVEECLFEGLKHWILRNYDTMKHGLPTWRSLVAAVDDSSGGHNHALALKIAKDHKQPEVLPPKQGSRTPSIPAVAVCSDPKTSQAMSTAFANMYRAISRLLSKSVQADELKEFLRCFCHPQSPDQLCVNPRVYERVTSTMDVLKQLCPKYINPVKLFVLEGIVETFGSRQCKKLLRDFQDKFYYN